MRINAKEDELRAAISGVLPDNAKLVVFSGEDYTNKEAIALFASASVVIGTHGGAMANTLFCRPGECWGVFRRCAFFSHFVTAWGRYLALFYFSREEEEIVVKLCHFDSGIFPSLQFESN